MIREWWNKAEAQRWLEHLERTPLADLMAEAEVLTLEGHGSLVTYSRKVFIPLTRLCRDVCHYCTFATQPSKLAAPYLSLDEVVAIARDGVAAGCREALFTLGDNPESRYPAAQRALDAMGYASTLDYLKAAAQAVIDETGLLPHLNPGIMDAEDLVALRPVSASMGLMLETVSERLSKAGGPHHGSPDKWPERRLEAIEAAGEAKVPFTTGLLIGIGETRQERIESLLAIRNLHARFGHIQEVIIQNFLPKADTRMAGVEPLSLEEQLWTIAAARLILGPEMTIQAPPNLRPDGLAALIRAGVNDWGGVSPVTPDHVNPEAPWPHLLALEQATQDAGRLLRQRLAIGPRHAMAPDIWLDPAIAPSVRRTVDGRGLPYADDWRAGSDSPLPFRGGPGGGACQFWITTADIPHPNPSPEGEGLFGAALLKAASITRSLDRAGQGKRLDQDDISAMFDAEGSSEAAIIDQADLLRAASVGHPVTYVINRNINYTNICLYSCGFCAFSKGSTKSERGPAYRLDLETVTARALEASARGATEVCLQGGIHPSYDGNTYLDIVRAVKAAVPDMHIHAFSPLEITHGAKTLGLPLPDYLAQLREAGLASLPGTAAEILADEVRSIICPDKLNSDEWLSVMRAAHGVGLKSTATIMFGHVERYDHWAQHLLSIRDSQEESGGFTEFVPLPFVHMEAPLWRKGQARSGPSWRETRLMHAVARLVLHPLIPNIQASWVKLGREGAAAMLRAGANDLGGVLMDESITRAAGGVNGQLCAAEEIHAIAAAAGRLARQRTTLYHPVERELEIA